MKLVAAFGAAVLSLTIAVAGLAAGGVAEPSPPSATALSEIPASLLPVYQDAARTCDGLGWQVLAAIGYLESRHAANRSDPISGDVNPPIVGAPLDGRDRGERIPDATSADGWMHAQGAMQFLPTTWSRWARLAPHRPAGARPSIQNAWDSIYTAAAYLCQDAPKLGDLRAAIDNYAGTSSYYARVIAKAIEYGYGQTTPGGDVGVAAVGYAMSQLGVPYVYGAETPAQGFDCSGLLYWAYAQAGVQIPRVTYDEVRIGTAVSVADLLPGDLIFSRGDVPTRDYGHVAMYIGNGIEINAPHTGAVVSLRPINPQRIQSIRRVA